MVFDLSIFTRNYLAAGLDESGIKQVADLAELKVARAGEEIIKLGAKDPDLYIIIDGTAIVYRRGGVLLGERGAGSVVGEVALVDDRPRSAYVLAKGTVTYARLDGVKLRRLMSQNKEVGFVMLSNLSRVLSMRLREASETIEDLQGRLGDPWKFAG